MDGVGNKEAGPRPRQRKIRIELCVLKTVLSQEQRKFMYKSPPHTVTFWRFSAIFVQIIT